MSGTKGLVLFPGAGSSADHSSLVAIEDLMQPFVRGNAARTVQGSGLGLAIVKRIVDIHQGELSISNRPEGGLQAIVSLPLSIKVEEEPTPTNPIQKIKQSLSDHF